MRNFIKRLLCFHDPSQIITSWPEIYFGGYGDAYKTRVGIYKCNKCNGIYEWYMPYGNPSVRTNVIGQARAKYAPIHAKLKLKEELNKC
jgi:hypothetical protein